MATSVGKKGNLITIKPYQNEQVIINGGLSGGSYLHFEDLIITDNAFTDRSAANSNDGIQVNEGNEYYYCTVKNHNQGFSAGSGKNNYKIHGCNVLYNGWDSQLGHGLYCQHDNNNGIALFTGIIAHHNLGFGFHLWSASLVHRSMTLQRNISFLNGDIRGATKRDILVGTQQGIENIVLENNRTYSTGESVMLGWGTGNSWANVQARSNVFAGITALRLNEAVLAETTVTDNALYGGLEPATIADDYPSNTFDTLANLPDSYYLDALEDPNRANLTIYNPSQANTVVVDVSPLDWNSGTVNAKNSMDELVDIQTLEITNGTITVNMQAINRTVETPVGWTAPATTFPRFGCMRLEKVT